MSRFAGWNEAALLKLGQRVSCQDMSKPVDIIPKIIPKKKDKPDYIAPIKTALSILGIESVREYKFLHDRRFKFDLAILEHKVCVEYEGGTFTNGRHTRGKGYSNDCKKYNLATMHGWKLLRYTVDRTKKENWEFEVADEIKELIKNGIKYARRNRSE